MSIDEYRLNSSQNNVFNTTKIALQMFGKWQGWITLIEGVIVNDFIKIT